MKKQFYMNSMFWLVLYPVIQMYKKICKTDMSKMHKTNLVTAPLNLDCLFPYPPPPPIMPHTKESWDENLCFPNPTLEITKLPC
jgi:hypothetical protein